MDLGPINPYGYILPGHDMGHEVSDESIRGKRWQIREIEYAIPIVLMQLWFHYMYISAGL